MAIARITPELGLLSAASLCVAGVPVYLPCAADALARQALALERDLVRWRQQRALSLSSAMRRPERAPSMKRVADALGANIALLERVREALLPSISTDALLRVMACAPQDSAYGADEVIKLLRRDWSGLPDAEQEVATLVRATRQELGKQTRPPKLIVVLGAGLGRLADEIAAPGVQVHAIELSAPLAIAAALLRQGPLCAFAVQTRNAFSGHDQARGFEARWRPSNPSQKAQSLIADATALPYPDGSVDCVVSVYFTDVVAPRKLLPEVRRVLRKGGHFVHVGPLGYHAPDTVEHLSAEDLIDEFKLYGFDVPSHRWVQGAHHLDAGSMQECRFHNLVFTATSDQRLVARQVVGDLRLTPLTP